MSYLDQICFTNEVNCLKFLSHRMRANMCTHCMKNITKHCRNSVTEEDVIKSLEYTQKGEKYPTLILNSDEKYGKLFLGGFKAAMNLEFLQQESVANVVNTAGMGLYKTFGKKYEDKCHWTMEVSKVECLQLEWEDAISYNISNEDIDKVINYIHSCRLEKKNVLVHCAQGKSRSATAVIAYIMVVLNLSLAESFAFVKEKRLMVEPNAHFMYLLQMFENSELIKKLRNHLRSLTL
ncbi:dual specificity protein phosphatase 22 isoform X1 [Hydra vulgaris]|uniref:dual specificity protein phosphatase 22 isoform X1 n=1 Tax=Hydra vulgaris TaxID=6087 RepID=UPI0002B42EAD|nr:dual specificity protein phosphatase 22 [Hydra vulgaris]